MRSGLVNFFGKDISLNKVAIVRYIPVPEEADIQHWRRRYFKLIGATLVGYHESTRARRATINLAKSTRVVDDRKSLIETPPAKGRNGARRKSGFVKEEAEGY